MAMVFEFITMLAMLALGFVFGRIWQMRQEIRHNQQIAHGGVDAPRPSSNRAQIPTAYLDRA